MKRIWQNCEVCWKVKHQPTNLAATNTKTIPKPEGIWETLNADYIQLDDHLQMLVILDEYILRTNGGSDFIGSKVSDYLKSVSVTHYVSSPHNHTSNAFAERFNRTICEAIRAQSELSYTDAVYALTYAYNRTKHTSTGYPPCFFILNTANTFSDEIAVNLSLSGLKDIIQFGRTEFDESQPKRKGKVLSPSMFVIKRVLHKKLNHTSHKNQDIFEGFYKIIKHLHAYTYIIQKCSRTGRLTGREERVTTDRLKVIPSLSTSSNNI
uniref:Integrase catalytic domain-containing protein n=1 Tax=Strongyloides venezuelensis TaxID=75913 RepID=A0A0K0F2A6_STRVS